MIIKTSGIILHSLKYAETSIIARIYTRELGLQSYLVPGVRKTKAKIKQNLFQPLCILDLVVYHKEREGLHRIREISCPRPYSNIPYDIQKTSIAIFLAEIMQHALKSQEASPSLFDFLRDAFYHLDSTTEKIADFHLVFLLKLSRHLGFQPRNNYDASRCFFNLSEGVFQHAEGHPEICLDKELSRHFFNIMRADLHLPESLVITKEYRKKLLHKIIDYYRHHLAGMPEVKSHGILETVMHS